MKPAGASKLALSELPALYREALLLVAIEGMRPAEAAMVCGITPEAMRQRLSRARAAIAKRLDERDGPVLAAPERGDDMIQPLPLLTPNAQRGQRTIARCHERLAHRANAWARRAQQHDIPRGRARAHRRALRDLHIRCRARGHPDAQRWLIHQARHCDRSATPIIVPRTTSRMPCWMTSPITSRTLAPSAIRGPTIDR